MALGEEGCRAVVDLKPLPEALRMPKAPLGWTLLG